MAECIEKPWWSMAKLWQSRGIDNFWEVGALSLYRAICGWSGPAWCQWWNLIIRVRKARSKILDLARYAVIQVMLSLHFSFKLELPLLCCHPTLQGISSLTKPWENTIFYTMHVLGWKCLRAICLAERFLTWKGNNHGWWGSPGRYGS